MAEDCRYRTNYDRPSHHPHAAPRRHQQVIIHQCRGGQEEVVVAVEEEDRPDIPSWVVALYRLITTGDFCQPGGRTSQADRRGRQKRIIMLQNSATTCDMSDDHDDDNSILSLSQNNDEIVAMGRHLVRVDDELPLSPPIRPRPVAMRACTTIVTPPLIQRPRLPSHGSSSLTLSCRTNDSSIAARHRRHSQKDLPTPEQIWYPLITTTMTTTTTTPLTIPYWSDDDDNSITKSQNDDDDESLDLSESDASREDTNDDDTTTIIMTDGLAKLVDDDQLLLFTTAVPPPVLRPHDRNLSYCSSSSEQDSEEESTTTQATYDDDKAADDEERDDTALDQDGPEKREMVGAPGGDWTLDWLTGNSSAAADPLVSSTDIAGAAAGAVQDHSNEPAYLPIYPVPPSASTSMAASIFAAGWCAVFYDDLKPLRINQELLLDIMPSNICYLQLLSGGMLQLTSAVDGEERKTVLVSPQSVDSSNLKLLSKRIGHCLVLETTTTMSTAAYKNHLQTQQTLFVLPIRLPGSFRADMTDYFAGQRNEPPSIPSLDLFFPPSHNNDNDHQQQQQQQQQQYYPPNPQHEAAIHLSFALDAALRLDAAMTRRCRQRPR
jgi:hypothetical protein